MSIVKVIGNGNFGIKGDWLVRSDNAGLTTSKMGIITSSVFDSLEVRVDDRGDKYVQLKEGQLDGELEELLKHFEGKVISIRSSETTPAEHGLTSSGLYTTVFQRFRNAKEAVPFFREICVNNVLNSVFCSNAIAYRKKHGIEQPSMAVLVTELVSSYDPNLKFNDKSPHTGGFAPKYSGYFNSMYPSRDILGLVRGLGTLAVSGIRIPLFHFNPKTGEIIHSQNSQDKLHYFDDYTSCLKYDIGFHEDINDQTAEAIYSHLKAIETALSRSVGLPPEYGFSIEYAIPSDDLTQIYVVDAKPVRKKLTEPTFPAYVDNLVKGKSYIGRGRKDISTIIDIAYCYEYLLANNFESLRELNERIKDYLLIVDHFATVNWREGTRDTRLPYSVFYNAAAMLELDKGERVTDASGAEHFALICNDDGILYVGGQLNAKGNWLLMPSVKQRQAENRQFLREPRVFNMNLSLVVDADLDRSVLYLENSH